MTLPALPAEGSTDWYDHYSAIHAAVAAGGGSGGAVGPQRMSAGAVYTPLFVSNNEMSGSSGRLYATAFPIDAPPPNGVDALGIRVTGAVAGATIRMGVYADTGQGFPGALALDAGAAACDTLGDKYLLAPWTPTPNLWWLVSLVLGGAPGFKSFQSGYSGTGLVMRAGSYGLDLGPGQSFFVNGHSALPATFPTAGWDPATQAPRIFLRTAA